MSQMTFRSVPDTELQWIKFYRQLTENDVVVTSPAPRISAMSSSGQVPTDGCMHRESRESTTKKAAKLKRCQFSIQRRWRLNDKKKSIMGSHRFMNYERAKMLENSIFILWSKSMSLLRPAKFELYNGLFQCWAQNLEKSPVPCVKMT